VSSPPRSVLSLRVWPASGAWESRRPAETPLRRDEAHVWLLSLVGTPEPTASSTRLLSGDERRRAERFRFDCHRGRWIQARVHLRRILGAYLACPPEAVELALDAHGKPRLGGPVSHRDLEFNLSHSGDLALFAIARERRVGVDVEVTPQLDVRRLSKRVLTERERAPLRELSGPRLEHEFLRCWTRKEAWIKALGEGMARDLQSFEVLVGDEVDRENVSPGRQSTDALWWLEDLTPSAHAVGCVAVEGDRPVVRLLTAARD
jgi:4'-phosphopantetheinyl transferase